MYRYEVAYFDEDRTYRWKGFKYIDKFEKFLNGLVRKGLKIIDLTVGDGVEVEEKYKKMYIK